MTKFTREDYEMAAKAYWGAEADDVMSFYWDEGEQSIVYIHADNQDHNGNDVELLWNPPEDEGATLRLAVKLGIHSGYNKFTGCGFASWSRGTCGLNEYGPDDPCATTCRAIFRAAIAIGRAMP